MRAGYFKKDLNQLNPLFSPSHRLNEPEAIIALFLAQGTRLSMLEWIFV
jgi:hypothetical protein